MIYEALGLINKKRPGVDPHRAKTLLDPPRCYTLVVHRFYHWPSKMPSIPYRDRIMSRCGLPDRGLRRKALFWYKRGHRLLLEEQYVIGSVGDWARSTGLAFRATELSKNEVTRMTPCEQISAFA